jgi:hypothetical protein
MSAGSRSALVNKKARCPKMDIALRVGPGPPGLSQPVSSSFGDEGSDQERFTVCPEEETPRLQVSHFAGIGGPLPFLDGEDPLTVALAHLEKCVDPVPIRGKSPSMKPGLSKPSDHVYKHEG